MKLRNGFVSNSSSSSFCIIGRNVNPSDLKNFSPNDLMRIQKLWVSLGFYEGEILTNLDIDMYNVLVKYIDRNNNDIKFDIYEADWAGEAGGIINPSDICPGAEVMLMDIDQNSPRILEELIERLDEINEKGLW